MRSLVLHYLFYLCKFFAVGYIFYRLGRKFHAPDPYWHYLIPIWNYIILCRCTRLSKYYAVFYHVLYFVATMILFLGESLNEPALLNIWVCLFIMCIMLEAEIFGRLAQRLNKDFWLYGFSGFVAYFPLILLVLAKEQPVEEIPKQLPPASRGDYRIY